MYCVRKVTDDLYWVGADDHRLARFENFHPIPRGISYNAYLLMDEKTVLFDTVDWSCCRQLMENLEHLLAGRPLDYLVIDHVEPDHGAAIREVLFLYPNVRIICSKMGAKFLNQFGFSDSERLETVADGNTRCFGKHEVQFFTAPMVHWPEVIVSFDQTNGVLFSADAFGSFSALDGKLFNDEVDYDRDWIDETRRYYTNIVGKYGPQVQDLLKKTCCLDIKMICPLHGLVWRSNLPYLMDKHDKWSRYEPEEEGVLIVWGSMYGDTENAAGILAQKLTERGITRTAVYDVSGTHVSYLIAETFRYSHLVLASVTYNMNIFPPMHGFLADMKGLNLQNRTVAFLEGGSWAVRSGTLMREEMGNLPNMRLLEGCVTVKSSLREEQLAELDALADRIADSMQG